MYSRYTEGYESQDLWVPLSEAGKCPSPVDKMSPVWRWQSSTCRSLPCWLCCLCIGYVMQAALRAPSGAEGPLSPCAESHNLLTCILSSCLDKSAASFALTHLRQPCTAARWEIWRGVPGGRLKMITISESPEYHALIHSGSTDLWSHQVFFK